MNRPESQLRALVNGRFFTSNRKQPWAEAVVIEGQKIEFVGSNTQARELLKEGDEVIDLGGKFATPGFIDGHIHALCAIYMMHFAKFVDIKTAEDAIPEIRNIIHENSSSDQIFSCLASLTNHNIGGNYFANSVLNKRMLDEMCPDKPVVIMLSNCHEAVCNSLALKLAGIDKNTCDPDKTHNDYFQRDPEGIPTGYLTGRRAIDALMKGASYLENPNLPSIVKRFISKCSELGVTSVIDCGDFSFTKGAIDNELAQLLNGEEYPLRFVGCGYSGGKGGVGAEGIDWPFERNEASCSYGDAVKSALDEAIRLNKQFSGDKFNCNFAKICLDGRAEIFADFFGIDRQNNDSEAPQLSAEEIVQCGCVCAKNGLDLNVHTFCSDAIHTVLEVAKKLRELGYNDMRITTSHTPFVKDEDLEMFGVFDVTANSSGSFIPMMPQQDVDRAKSMTGAKSYPLRSIIKAGGRVGLGTDYPFVTQDFNPLFEIEQVVTRQTIADNSDDGYVNSPEEALSVAEAIEAYTINNAYQANMQDKIGSLEASKYADIVIFDQDLFKVDPKNIHNVRVAGTIMNGVTQYHI